MPSRLSDRISAARWTFFVGREAELALFRKALAEEPLPYNILHVYGPGGVGKTTLLRAFAFACSQERVPSLIIDGRTIEPSPAAFTAALQAALRLPAGKSPVEYLNEMGQRFVLLIDTSETLAPMDEWLRTEFIPALPENALVVLAGRYPPGSAWRSDPGLSALVRVWSLRNLAPQEGSDYLARRGIPQAQHGAMLDFTHGHPLALSLLADVLSQRAAGQAEALQAEAYSFVPEETPDVVKTLLEQFIQEAPDPAHRTALEACALVRVTSETLMSAMLDAPNTQALFDWLRGLSFIESRRDGVFPHDLAREALIADLRWRNPEWFGELHRRARNFYMAHLSAEAAARSPAAGSPGKGEGPARLDIASNQEAQRVLWDYIFLHRDNPVIKPFFEWQASASLTVSPAEPADLPHLAGMVREHEGSESAALCEYWLAQQPRNALVLRDSKRRPVGFMSWVDLDQAPPEGLQRDPAARAAWAYLQNKAPLRSGERAILFRYWLAADTYQDVSPIQSLLFVNIVRMYLTTPNLAFTFLPCANSDFWAPGFAYGDLSRTPETDFEISGRHFGVYTHDWRAVPPLAWLERMAGREMGLPISDPSASPAPALLVLSEEEFHRAIREALNNFTRPESLVTNPLVRSRLVEVEGSATDLERAQRLRRVIQQAAEVFQSSPKDEKFYRVLDKTYFRPAPTQEIAAELLDLPFSTYRRHLKTAIERVSETLWLQELGK